MIDLNATAFAGFVLIGAIIGMWLYEIANGRDGNPYGLLGAVAGVVYIAGVAWGGSGARPTGVESPRRLPHVCWRAWGPETFTELNTVVVTF